MSELERPTSMIDPSKVTSLTFGNFLSSKAARNGDKTFLTFLTDGRILSYREADEQSNRLANSLLGLGVGHGTHVAVMMDNCPEQILVYFALAKIGAVSVPINSAAKGQFLTYYLNHSDASVLIAEETYLERFGEDRKSVE